MASGPITSWKTEGERAEAVTDFLFLGSKIIVNSDCIYEIRRQLPLGRKAMTNLDNVLKGKDITADKSLYSKDYSLSTGHAVVRAEP